jgi:hypothetical protein
MSLIDVIRERIHRPHDELARAQGLVVEELPNGRRRVSDPRLPEFFERRRRRLLREGLGPVDRALMDPATAQLFAATARRVAAEMAGVEAAEAEAGSRTATTRVRRTASAARS